MNKNEYRLDRATLNNAPCPGGGFESADPSLPEAFVIHGFQPYE